MNRTLKYVLVLVIVFFIAVGWILLAPAFRARKEMATWNANTHIQRLMCGANRIRFSYSNGPPIVITDQERVKSIVGAIRFKGLPSEAPACGRYTLEIAKDTETLVTLYCAKNEVRFGRFLYNYDDAFYELLEDLRKQVKSSE